MNTAPPRRNQYETRLQIYLVELFAGHVKPEHAILAMTGNGSYRTPETLRLITRMGLVEGLPDLLLVLPTARLHWIEVKLERTLWHLRTDLTGAQPAMHARLIEMGHTVSVVRNPREFWDVVEAEKIPHTLREFPPQQATFEFSRRPVKRARTSRGSRPSVPAASE